MRAGCPAHRRLQRGAPSGGGDPGAVPRGSPTTCALDEPPRERDFLAPLLPGGRGGRAPGQSGAPRGGNPAWRGTPFLRGEGHVEGANQ